MSAVNAWPPPQRPTRVIAIANQKGGVGKTTTAVNLAACLAERGRRTLLIDLDPQGNATTGLGLTAAGLDHSMYDVLVDDVELASILQPTELDLLTVAPASLELAGAELDLISEFSREARLKDSLAPLLHQFDVVLIDCPPSLSLLTVNALTAAREVLIPVQTEYFALQGLSQLLRTIDQIRRRLNPTLRVCGIACVMYDARTNLATDVVREVREHFGELVFDTVVPRNVKLSEAPSHGQPITVWDPASRGAIAYRDLAAEITLKEATNGAT
jgi:chromosome partitioning protein